MTLSPGILSWGFAKRQPIGEWEAWLGNNPTNWIQLYLPLPFPSVPKYRGRHLRVPSIYGQWAFDGLRQLNTDFLLYHRWRILTPRTGIWDIEMVSSLLCREFCTRLSRYEIAELRLGPFEFTGGISPIRDLVVLKLVSSLFAVWNNLTCHAASKSRKASVEVEEQRRLDYSNRNYSVKVSPYGCGSPQRPSFLRERGCGERTSRWTFLICSSPVAKTRDNVAHNVMHTPLSTKNNSYNCHYILV